MTVCFESSAMNVRSRARDLAAAVLICTTFMVGAAAAQQAPALARPIRASSEVDACRAMAGRKFPGAEVTSAATIGKGETVATGDKTSANVTVDVCRVHVRLWPVKGSTIEAEVWLPSDWNQKLYGIGGGGFDGGLSPATVPLFIRATEQGYAAVASDAGHKAGASMESWAHQQPERVVDFAHRGNHVAAVAAKRLIASYYGRSPRHSYFVGCSNGGRDAVMAARRYPADYDGIVAGAPAIRYLEVLTQMIWFHDAVHGPGGAPSIGSKLGLVNRAVLDKCDSLDGVKDGILENPRQCSFDPGELRCEGSDSPACLTDTEVAAFRKIYGGPRYRNGKGIYDGPALGSEEGAAGWAGWVVPEGTSWFGQEFYRWLVFDDPTWNVQTFDIDRDYPRALERIAPIVNANDPDLGAFARRKGRLILYQGWNDAGITPTETIKYFENVSRRLGARSGEHVRLFMVPGMAHCAEGPGASSFDMLPALERWVEKGEAPTRVIATRPGSTPEFTRPLCPWPMTARYDGSGSTNEAASFTCR